MCGNDCRAALLCHCCSITALLLQHCKETSECSLFVAGMVSARTRKRSLFVAEACKTLKMWLMQRRRKTVFPLRWQYAGGRELWKGGKNVKKRQVKRQRCSLFVAAERHDVPYLSPKWKTCSLFVAGMFPKCRSDVPYLSHHVPKVSPEGGVRCWVLSSYGALLI